MTENLMRPWHLERELAEEERILAFLAAGEKEFCRTQEKIDTITEKIVALRASVGYPH